MNKITASITSVGGYVPDYILTNHELEKMVDTNDEWITSRTGIKERRILKEPGKGTSFMCARAVNKILEKTGLDPKDIDLLICATVTPDMQFPATANFITDEIGATNAFGYDINAACSGFIYALVTGAKFIESGTHKNVIVVGADKMSAIIDYTDRQTCIIFGDGAGAVLLQPDTNGFGIIDSILKSDGSGSKYLHQKAGGSVKPASHQSIDAREHFVFQEGQPVFKAAIQNMSDVCAQIMERNKLTADQVAWLVPHQANKRIIETTASRMGIENEKIMLNIQRYGNTTGGTIPLCLFDYEPQLRKGDNLVLAAFGGGFTWGSVYVKWAYDPK